jgi:ABC-2 type transport system ATP-binding protein
MDFILDKIFETADSDAAMLIATNRIADTERLFDDVIILQNGTVRSYDSAENMRRKNECSIEEHFREVYKCWES